MHLIPVRWATKLGEISTSSPVTALLARGAGKKLAKETERSRVRRGREQ